jgi:hypothetical protein
MRSACAFRCAALRRRRFFAGVGATAGAATISGFFGGLPRRFAGPWRASMARFSLSRSAISKERIWSMGMKF